MARPGLLLGLLALVGLVSGQCAKPRQRPEIRSLSPEDRGRFFRALNELRNNGELDRLSKMHVDNADTIHGHPVFMVFHRVFVNDFASAIEKVDPGVLVPYWDWSLDASNPIASSVFTADYCGGNGSGDKSCVANGPFSNWEMKVDSPHCLARKFNQGDSIAPFWPPEALLSMQRTCNQYGALSSGIENGCHGAVHLGISGDMSTMFAPNDPFFFLHHGMVDKLWYDWQLAGPGERFQMYDGVNYADSGVSADDVIPGYPNMRVKDALDPRNGLCYVYIDSGSGAATKRLMQEVDRQSGAPAAEAGQQPPSQQPPQEQAKPVDGANGGGQSGAPASFPGGGEGGTVPGDMANSPSPDSIVAPGATAGGSGQSAGATSQLDALTSQVSRLSGDGTDRAEASAALHDQQVGFLKDMILNGMGQNGGVDMASAFLHHHHRSRFLTRRAAAILRRTPPQETPGLDLNGILSGLATGLLGSDGVVADLLKGLGHVVEVLPQGLGKTLEAVGSIAKDVTDDVFDILKLPKVDLSKVPEEERRIPYVAELPDWWYKNNNLNATYAAQLRAQVHDMIDGFNRIPGYISPAVAHYVAGKYGQVTYTADG
ncbi:hypothetical protein H4R21_002922 [Coemansia helicoidea]|uniref:Uncharacterized protein n=1 Tax=Coemansia helicoidea TaxID=1286919 RepID=A0ACC1L5T1_9FUNG|nr:hypothetical protein H4R21_002922 [Coemansia helicoidea]